jgi:hypothetical protein
MLPELLLLLLWLTMLLMTLPGPTLMVMPSVVMGPVMVEGSVKGVELISIPLGPTTMVSLPIVMVEVCDPISMVEPPMSMSVTVAVMAALETPLLPPIDCEPGWD